MSLETFSENYLHPERLDNLKGTYKIYYHTKPDTYEYAEIEVSKEEDGSYTVEEKFYGRKINSHIKLKIESTGGVELLYSSEDINKDEFSKIKFATQSAQRIIKYLEDHKIKPSAPFSDDILQKLVQGRKLNWDGKNFVLITDESLVAHEQDLADLMQTIRQKIL